MLGDGVEMTFSFIPPGTFLMGSPPQEEGRQDDEVRHRVTLTRGFWMAVYPVTQAQWVAVMGGNPSRFKGDDPPVEQVSWDDCQAFCERLDDKTGLRSRLPTEAEWEYACRAGATTAFSFGEAEGLLERYAWYLPNAELRAWPVGHKRPNDLGLFDVHGNVSTWCQEASTYPAAGAAAAVADREENRTIAFRTARAARGCNCTSPAFYARSAARSVLPPSYQSPSLGLRVARTIR